MRTRRTHDATFKAKVALEVVKGVRYSPLSRQKTGFFKVD